MGNVQSEATQESETTKDGEEKAKPDRSKPNQTASGAKRETGSWTPVPQTRDLKDARQTPSNEPGGGDRPSGAAETGKSNLKKSKLKLSSMWAENSASSEAKGASLGDKGSVTERQGPAGMSRADLQSGQNTGSVLPEEQKGLKAAFRLPHGVAQDPKDPGPRRAAAKEKSKAENAPPALLPQPERLTEPGPGRAAQEDAVEAKPAWTPHIKPNSKEHPVHEGRPPGSALSPRKPPESSTHTPAAPLNANEDATGASKSPSDRNASRPASACGAAPPGGKKLALSWGSGHREKEPGGQEDSAPGSGGDSKGPVPASQLLAEPAMTSGSPVGKRPALESGAKAEGKSEAVGAEAVSSKTMQELLERGLNFLYKVTIQPGQWPPSIKAVKPKEGPVPLVVSYADVLKQCPQKRGPSGAPALPKALHPLTTAGKKLPSLKDLEKSHPEDFTSLSQLFLEHFKKVAPKEPGGHPPGPQVVTFREELSPGSPKRPEWQRPRPPTPYPQRRKGPGRKLPKLGAAVSQVVAFLGSDSKCDWFVHGEGQAALDEAAVLAEEEGRDPPEPLGTGEQGAEEAGSSLSVPTCLLDEAITVELDESVQISPQKAVGLLEGVKGTILLASPPCNSAPGPVSPPATPQATQAEDRTPPPVPKSPSPSETSEVSTNPTGSAPCAPVGPAPEQKAPAAAQARPKVRKPGPVAPKSKEKLLCAPGGPEQKPPAMAQARPKVRKPGPVPPKSKEKLKSLGQAKGKAPKGKGPKQWPRCCGVTSPLKLDGVPLFAPFEKVKRPFYFGEPSEVPLSPDEPAAPAEDVAASPDVPEQDREEPHPTEAHRWPAFQVTDSCPRKCYCRHQNKRKLPKNVVAWLNPTANHLAEPPWVATTLLAVSLVAGTKFCLDSYNQEHDAHKD